MMAQDTPRIPASLDYLPQVQAYLKRKSCATYKEIAESLNISTARVKVCFEAGKLKYKGNLKPPNIGFDAMVRRSETARLIWNHMDPSGGNKVIVMDKVSYISADPNSNHFNTHVYMPKGQRPTKAFWAAWELTRDARPDFYLVWQAMTSDGLVSPFVTMINKFDTKEYVEECLRKVLVPWLKENYKLEDVLLWPDMCPRHNSSQVTKFLNANKISYVKKRDNAPKLTHARPIEFCLDKCKEKYRPRSRSEVPADDLEEFRRVYTEVNEEVMEKYAKELCAEIPDNLLAIERCYM